MEYKIKNNLGNTSLNILPKERKYGTLFVPPKGTVVVDIDKYNENQLIAWAREGKIKILEVNTTSSYKGDAFSGVKGNLKSNGKKVKNKSKEGKRRETVISKIEEDNE